MVQKRGELMHREALANPGDMVAVIGMDIDGVQEVIDEKKTKMCSRWQTTILLNRL